MYLSSKNTVMNAVPWLYDPDAALHIPKGTNQTFIYFLEIMGLNVSFFIFIVFSKIAIFIVET